MQRDTINKLKLWEVLDYYDEPKFYSCKDVTGQIKYCHGAKKTKIGIHAYFVFAHS